MDFEELEESLTRLESVDAVTVFDEARLRDEGIPKQAFEDTTDLMNRQSTAVSKFAGLPRCTVEQRQQLHMFCGQSGTVCVLAAQVLPERRVAHPAMLE